jgi:hypothetical protein
VGTETAHALSYAQPSLRNNAALRSIIHAASIDCAGVFARNANAAHHGIAIGLQLFLTLRA